MHKEHLCCSHCSGDGVLQIPGGVSLQLFSHAEIRTLDGDSSKNDLPYGTNFARRRWDVQNMIVICRLINTGVQSRRVDWRVALVVRLSIIKLCKRMQASIPLAFFFNEKPCRLHNIPHLATTTPNRCSFTTRRLERKKLKTPIASKNLLARQGIRMWPEQDPFPWALSAIIMAKAGRPPGWSGRRRKCVCSSPAWRGVDACVLPECLAEE